MPEFTTDTITLISACVIVLSFVTLGLVFAESAGEAIQHMLKNQDLK